MGDAGKYYRDMGQGVVNDLNNKDNFDELFNKALDDASAATTAAMDAGEIDGSDGSIGDYMSQKMFDAYNNGALGNMSKDEFIKRITQEDMGYASPMHNIETDLPQQDVTK